MISRFKISNFRGIKTLIIDNIKQLNLFLGYNNCGKSSVLEALYLFGDPSHPANDIQINRARHYLKADRSVLPLNFYNLDTSSSIMFDGAMDNGENRQLTIDFIAQSPSKTDYKDMTLTNLKYDKIYGLSNTLNIKSNGEEKVYKFAVEPINDNEARVGANKHNDEYNDSFNCGFMPAGSTLNDYLESFKEIVENKEESNVTEALRNIEPNLQGLVLVDNQIMADIGLSKLIPIQLLGDGIRKLFSIIIFIYQLKGGIALLDEIDNGLHYKSMPTLWNTIIRLATKYDVQLFITTHNIDSLKALSNVLASDMQDFQDKCNLYTLRRNDNGAVAAIRSDFKQFNYMFKQEMELR